MGNEGSLPSEGSVASELPSERHSFISEVSETVDRHSVMSGPPPGVLSQSRRSSMSSGQGDRRSPDLPPQPDLSHLTEEERTHIAMVLAKAKQLQEEEEQRVRDLEEDFATYAETVVRRASLVSIEDKDKNLCPICHENEVQIESSDINKEGQKCQDCDRVVCLECGGATRDVKGEKVEWLCSMCQRRRKLVTSTGLWYHGYNGGRELADVEIQLEMLETEEEKDKFVEQLQLEHQAVILARQMQAELQVEENGACDKDIDFVIERETAEQTEIDVEQPSASTEASADSMSSQQKSIIEHEAMHEKDAVGDAVDIYSVDKQKQTPVPDYDDEQILDLGVNITDLGAHNISDEKIADYDSNYTNGYSEVIDSGEPSPLLQMQLEKFENEEENIPYGTDVDEALSLEEGKHMLLKDERSVSPPLEAIYSDSSSDSESSSSSSSSSSTESETDSASEEDVEGVESPINAEELAVQYSPYYEKKVKTGEVYPIEEEEEETELSNVQAQPVSLKGVGFMSPLHQKNLQKHISIIEEKMKLQQRLEEERNRAAEERIQDAFNLRKWRGSSLEDHMDDIEKLTIEEAETDQCIIIENNGKTDGPDAEAGKSSSAMAPIDSEMNILDVNHTFKAADEKISDTKNTVANSIALENFPLDFKEFDEADEKLDNDIDARDENDTIRAKDLIVEELNESQLEESSASDDQNAEVEQLFFPHPNNSSVPQSKVPSAKSKDYHISPSSSPLLATSPSSSHSPKSPRRIHDPMYGSFDEDSLYELHERASPAKSDSPVLRYRDTWTVREKQHGPSPASPKDKRFFTSAYTDISPPSRPLSREDLYGDEMIDFDSRRSSSESTPSVKPSPTSPDEMKTGMIVTVTGARTYLEKPEKRADEVNSANEKSELTQQVPECEEKEASSEDVEMEPFATSPEAATISNILVMAGVTTEASSSQKTAQTSTDLKPLDITKKQHRSSSLPSAWSPIIDLSPIIDVSPSVEIEEEKQMLREQKITGGSLSARPDSNINRPRKSLPTPNIHINKKLPRPAPEIAPRKATSFSVDVSAVMPKKIHRKLPQPVTEAPTKTRRKLPVRQSSDPTVGTRDILDLTREEGRSSVSSKPSRMNENDENDVHSDLVAYQVLESPVTPVQRSSLRSYYDSKPLSPSSSPDEYAIKDTREGGGSPPAPLSPSATPPNVCFTEKKSTNLDDQRIDSDSSKSSSKTRRKLPTIPQNTEPVQPSRKGDRDLPEKKSAKDENDKNRRILDKEETKQEKVKSKEKVNKTTHQDGDGIHNGMSPSKFPMKERHKEFTQQGITREYQERIKTEQIITRPDTTEQRLKEHKGTQGVYAPIPDWFKTLKQQLKDELKVAVAKRQMRLDEMQAQLEMEQMMNRFRESHHEAALRESGKISQDNMAMTMKQFLEEKQQRYDIHGKISSPTAPLTASVAPTATTTRMQAPTKPQVPNRLSPQTSPRRTRHRRQGSDPKVMSKFSPIKEDKKMEQELQAIEMTTGVLSAKLAAHSLKFHEMGRYRSDPTLHYSATRDKVSQGFITSKDNRNKSSSTSVPRTQPFYMSKGLDEQEMYEEMLTQLKQHEQEIASLEIPPRPSCPTLDQVRENLDRSEASLQQLLKSIESSPYNSEYSDFDEDERVEREKKKTRIKAEIEKRKRHIEEEARLHEELSRYEELMASSFLDAPSHVRPRSQPLPSLSPNIVETPRSSYTPTPQESHLLLPPFAQSLQSPRSLGSLTGNKFSEFSLWNTPPQPKQQPHLRSRSSTTLPDPQYTFMSIARPTEKRPTGIIKPLEEPSPLRYPEDYTNMEYAMYKEYRDQIDRAKRKHYISTYDYIPSASYTDISQYRGTSGLDTQQYCSHPAIPTSDFSFPRPGGQELHHYSREVPMGLQYSRETIAGMPYSRESGYSSITYDNTGDYSPIVTDVELSPMSDKTPAMPLLGDFTSKSRKRLEDLTGSGPLFPDVNNESNELLDNRYWGDSMENSSHGSVDPVVDSNAKEYHHSKAPPQTPSNTMVPIKRLLLTRDPKDRLISGNGLGMKVVGGKQIPGTKKEIGAYIAKIYRGGVVDTLNEVQEGDQVLEWNGISLTGKTYEKVQQIIQSSDAEVEILVRCGANMSGKVQLRSDRSSYDNLNEDAMTGDSYNDYFKEGGIDPNALAKQLETLHKTPEPPAQSGTVMSLTPSPPMSSSPSIEDWQNLIKLPPEDISGEIQLQLSYDDVRQRLFATIVRAINLKEKDAYGIINPFMKVYLLPGRSVENKWRTKHISNSRNPEWNETIMYENLPRHELVQRCAEFSVWNYVKTGRNDFLGEVLIDLADKTYLDNEPYWYQLEAHRECNEKGFIRPPRSKSPFMTMHRQSQQVPYQGLSSTERLQSIPQPPQRPAPTLPPNIAKQSSKGGSPYVQTYPTMPAKQSLFDVRKPQPQHAVPVPGFAAPQHPKPQSPYNFPSVSPRTAAASNYDVTSSSAPLPRSGSSGSPFHTVSPQHTTQQPRDRSYYSNQITASTGSQYHSSIPYPLTSSQHPQYSNQYPPSSGQYPQYSGQYPQSSGQHPQSSGQYPQSSGQYSQTSGQYPQTSGQYSQSSSQYPQSSTGPSFPQSKSGKHPQQQHNGPTTGPYQNSGGNDSLSSMNETSVFYTVADARRNSHNAQHQPKSETCTTGCPSDGPTEYPTRSSLSPYMVHSSATPVSPSLSRRAPPSTHRTLPKQTISTSSAELGHGYQYHQSSTLPHQNRSKTLASNEEVKNLKVSSGHGSHPNIALVKPVTEQRDITGDQFIPTEQITCGAFTRITPTKHHNRHHHVEFLTTQNNVQENNTSSKLETDLASKNRPDRAKSAPPEKSKESTPISIIEKSGVSKDKAIQIARKMKRQRRDVVLPARPPSRAKQPIRPRSQPEITKRPEDDDFGFLNELFLKGVHEHAAVALAGKKDKRPMEGISANTTKIDPESPATKPQSYQHRRSQHNLSDPSGEGLDGANFDSTSPRRSRRARNPDQHDRARNPDQHDRARNPDQHDRARNPDQHNRARNPDQHDRALNPDQRDRTRNPDQHNRARNPDQHDRALNPDQHDRAHNPDQRDRSRNPDQHDRARNPDQHDRAHNPDQHNRARNPDQHDRARNPDQHDRARNPDQRDRSRNRDHQDMSRNPVQQDRSRNPDHRDRHSSSKHLKERSSRRSGSREQSSEMSSDYELLASVGKASNTASPSSKQRKSRIDGQDKYSASYRQPEKSSAKSSAKKTAETELQENSIYSILKAGDGASSTDTTPVIRRKFQQDADSPNRKQTSLQQVTSSGRRGHREHDQEPLQLTFVNAADNVSSKRDLRGNVPPDVPSTSKQETRRQSRKSPTSENKASYSKVFEVRMKPRRKTQ